MSKNTEQACKVDHDERRRLGLLGCYFCHRDIQGIEEANAIRRTLGKHVFYGKDRVLRRVDWEAKAQAWEKLADDAVVAVDGVRGHASSPWAEGWLARYREFTGAKDD